MKRFILSLLIQFCWVAILCYWISSNCLGAGELLLSEKGRTTWTIILPNQATIVEKTAVNELQSHLQQVTGATFPVLKEQEIKEGQEHLILVGNTDRTQKILATEKNLLPFPFDAIYLKANKNTMVLTGHERRGTLYAVYTFLEDYVGCRWWTPEESFIPHKPDLKISDDLYLSYAPQMISREMYHRLAQPGLFSARLKGNGHITKEYGGRIDIIQFVHSFYRWIPPEKYFKDHPDWFSEVKGERTHHQAQLCLSNEAMRKELTKNVLETLRKTPGARIVDISQNDWYGFCTCKKCKEIDDKEGSHSGTLIHFLNEVAAEVEKEFPDVLVESLAYQYTRQPPKIVKPRKNILIRLCSIECSFVRPLDHPQNEKFAADINGWRSIASQLFIWDYVTNYNNYISPFPNYRVIAPNVRYFIKNGAIGLFAEGEGDDFVEVRNWILLHLMWNPQLDETKLFNDFCDGYYGKEITPFLREYQDLICKRAEESNLKIGCFAMPVTRWLDLNTLDKATQLMNQAVEKSKKVYGNDSPQLRRLRKTKIAIDYTWLKYYRHYKSQACNNNVSFTGPDDPITAIENFVKESKDFKIDSLDIRSHGAEAFERFKLELKTWNVRPKILPEFCKNVPTNNLFVYDDLLFNNVNNAAERVKDPDAWDGMATAMSTKVDWNTNYNPALAGTFHVWARLRCDAQTDDGNALAFGVYDWEAKKGLFSKTLSVKELKGKQYRWIDFGEITFTGDAGFWFAHRHDPKVSYIYVDQVIMIALKKGK